MLNLFMLYNPSTFSLLLYTAEDPVEVTLKSRALTTMAIATYAAKKRKRREAQGRW